MVILANTQPFYFRALVVGPGPREEQRDILVDDLYRAWCDALWLLQEHGLADKLPQRTLEATGLRPAVQQ